MPLPDVSCPPDTPPVTCCDTFSLIGDRIRTLAFNGVLACVEESCRAPYRSYLTFGPRIEDVLGDSVIATMLPATEIIASPQGRALFGSVTRVTYRVELRENGWPPSKVNEGRVIEVPDANLLNAKAHHAIAHGEKMWRTLKDGAAHRTGPRAMFDQSTNHHLIQGGIRVSDLTPIGPQAHQVAWAVTVSVDAIMAPAALPTGS